ncbi:methyltransferase [Pukyongiella litopenaei]|uniref:Methanethiol S-methyltransferase n=1 Tax=Pukyongiella litopenaei TaxID=2605946 RepID=A0A2S0MLV1_9RHOB|nr:methyltransferase [Pukyongiella litopenaei]AVO36859.1 hypothetical protein C6Y53_03555 [Pukyongiella litopenaei]
MKSRQWAATPPRGPLDRLARRPYPAAVASLADIRSRSSWGNICEGQLQHAGLAVLLTVGALSLLAAPAEAPTLLRLTSAGWAHLSIALALVHQVIVALGFRLQLHRNLLTRLLGDRDMAVWRAVFMPLLLTRPVTVLLTGWADTTPVTGHRAPEILLGAALLGLSGWALHSVLVHFTLTRALGGDHFREEIARLPLVRGGIYRHTQNAMYGVAFLGLWGIALALGSWNALVVALFQHCYIWVHMYCTEKPDMEWIYGHCPELQPGGSAATEP